MASRDTGIGCACHRKACGHTFGKDLRCENYRITRRGRKGAVLEYQRCPVTWDLHHERPTVHCPFPRSPGKGSFKVPLSAREVEWR